MIAIISVGILAAIWIIVLWGAVTFSKNMH